MRCGESEHASASRRLCKHRADRSFAHLRFFLSVSVVFPFLSLYEFIKNNNFKGISLGLIRRFAIQLLQSLRFLKGEKIIHCVSTHTHQAMHQTTGAYSQCMACAQVLSAATQRRVGERDGGSTLDPPSFSLMRAGPQT